MKKQIHSIFSSTPPKPTTPNPQTPIIIDTREKQSLVAAELLEQNANIKFEKLDIADYLINDIAIERKTFSDFVSSMIDKRILKQLKEIKKYPQHFLIIEGATSQRDKSNNNFQPRKGWERLSFAKEHLGGHPKNNSQNINPNLEKATKGLLLSIILNYQVPILYTKDQKDTAELLILLARKQTKQTPQSSLRFTKTLQTPEEQKQFILEGFPTIGPTTSKKLLEKFGSIKNIINAEEEELRKILGKNYETFKNLIEN